MGCMSLNMMHNRTMSNGSIDPIMTTQISGGGAMGYQPMRVTYAPLQATDQVIDGEEGASSRGCRSNSVNGNMRLSRQPSLQDEAAVDDEMPPLPSLDPEKIDKHDEYDKVPV